MSRSAFDEARSTSSHNFNPHQSLEFKSKFISFFSITPRVKTLEEILASITVTAREVLSYRKKRTCRSMVTEARIRYAF